MNSENNEISLTKEYKNYPGTCLRFQAVFFTGKRCEKVQRVELQTDTIASNSKMLIMACRPPTYEVKIITSPANKKKKPKNHFEYGYQYHRQLAY
jgi:hypothetical protein